MFKSNKISKKIITVGSDNIIKIWIDSINKDELTPLLKMPSESAKTISNQNDITCFTYIKPNYIVTGGNDGSIAFWDIYLGKFYKKFKYPKLFPFENDAVSCTKICTLDSLHAIVTAHTNGVLLIWNNDPSHQNLLIGYRWTAHQKFGGMTAMVSAKNDSILVTGDRFGIIQIWELNLSKSTMKVSKNGCDLKDNIKRLNVFQSGHSFITYIDYLSEKELLLSCDNNGKMFLWTLNGIKIGMFGQKTTIGQEDPIPKLWNLKDINTYEDTQPKNDSINIIDLDEYKYEITKDTNDNSNDLTDDLTLLMLNKNDNDNNEDVQLFDLVSKSTQHTFQKSKLKLVRKRLQTFNLDYIPKESSFK